MKLPKLMRECIENLNSFNKETKLIVENLSAKKTPYPDNFTGGAHQPISGRNHTNHMQTLAAI